MLVRNISAGLGAFGAWNAASPGKGRKEGREERRGERKGRKEGRREGRREGSKAGQKKPPRGSERLENNFLDFILCKKSRYYQETHV